MRYPPAFKVRTPKAKSSRPEDQLQASLVSYHAAAVDQRHAVVFAVPNGEKRDAVTAARLTGMSAETREALQDSVCLIPAGLGVLPGTTDLIVLLRGGRVLLVEVKIGKIMAPGAGLPLFPAGAPPVLHRAGVLSKVQKRFQAGAEALGHVYRVIRSLEAYADLLEEFGVPLRCRPWGPGVAAPRPPAAFGPA